MASTWPRAAVFRRFGLPSPACLLLVRGKRANLPQVRWEGACHAPSDGHLQAKVRLQGSSAVHGGPQYNGICAHGIQRFSVDLKKHKTVTSCAWSTRPICTQSQVKQHAGARSATRSSFPRPPCQVTNPAGPEHAGQAAVPTADALAPARGSCSLVREAARGTFVGRGKGATIVGLQYCADWASDACKLLHFQQQAC